MGGPHRDHLLSVLLALLLTGCGGGDNVDYRFASETSTDPDWVLLQADLDEDGRTDLLAFPRQAEGASLAWRGTRSGLAPSRTLGRGRAAGEIRSDVARRTDADLLASEGLHEAGHTLTGLARHAYGLVALARADAHASPGPEIDRLLMDAGRAGSLLGIRGIGLTTTDEPTQVLFDTTSVEPLLALPGFVLVEVPDGLAGRVVAVRVLRGEVTSEAWPFEVADRPQPVVEAVWPAPLVHGRWCALRGRQLGTPRHRVEVNIDGSPCPEVVALGTHVLARVPSAIAPSAAGERALVVRVDGVASEAIHVQVADVLPPPEISRLAPAAASSGSIVSIEGDHFLALGEPLRVVLGTREAAIFRVSANHLEVIVPPGAQDGDLVVHRGARESLGHPFLVLARGDPVIERITPATAQPGEYVEVEGRDLHDLSAWRASELPPLDNPFGDVDVRFGEQRAWFLIPTAKGLRVRVPAGAGRGLLHVAVGARAATPVPFDHE